ncbi:Alkaline phosphatase synthesis sensor protein PhoR [compost metagenome]
MSELYGLMLGIFGAALAAAGLLTGVYYKHQSRETFRRLNAMLDAAINHSFAETSFDETRISQIETKLSRFLTATTSFEELQGREKARIQQLISDISHQTKTPIANVLLYAQLLRESEMTDRHGMELTRQISQQAEKLNFLIQALIKTSRMETGIIRVCPQMGKVSELIQHTITQLEEKMQRKRIGVHLSCADDTTAIFDPKWTEEAIFNILDNSIKYTPDQGTITITVLNYELFVRIDITDTGMGIAEKEINLVFGRFYRSPRVGQIEGVGIGLYLAREIITMQQGYMKVSSVVAKGSTFSIFLPREPSGSNSVNIDRFQKEA